MSDVVLMCLSLTLLYAIKDTLKGVVFSFFLLANGVFVAMVMALPLKASV